MKNSVGKLLLFTVVFTFIWGWRIWWISFFSLSPQHTLNTADLIDPENRFFTETIAVYDNRNVPIPYEIAPSETKSPVTQTSQKKQILGVQNLYKWIEIDLSAQRLYAYENGNMIYNFLISSGKWNKTPTGRFQIWIKLRATKMEGGRKELGTYYYLPNVPYVMFFTNVSVPKYLGYGIHGTYWHSNFGHPMSHGCINMKTEEAELLYYWAGPELGGRSSIYASAENQGTEVIIYGVSPLN